MASDRSNKLAKLQEKLAQREQEAAKLRARLNAEITKKRNGQIMAWGEAIEAAYIKADDSQKSHIEAMILGALNGEGAKVKMWHRRATEGFARLKDKEIPTEAQKPITPKEKPQPAQQVQPEQAQSTPVASSTSEQTPIVSAFIVALKSKYYDKDEISEKGAIWDNEQRAWCVPANTDLRPFEKWLPKPLSSYKLF